MAINYQNELKYAQDQLKKAQETGNKGLETWAKQKAEEYAPEVARQQAARVGVSGPIDPNYSRSLAENKPHTPTGSGYSDLDAKNKAAVNNFYTGGGSSGGSSRGSSGSSGGGSSDGGGQPRQGYSQQNTPRDFADAIGQTMQQYSFPYEQAIRDLMGSAPSYTPPSEAELTGQARQWAELQVNPQISALGRAQEQAQQALQSQRGQVQASYAGMEEKVDRTMQEAAQKALESAISRGGGRSGAVEWLTNKLQQPVAEQFTGAQAQQAQELADIASRGSLLQEQYGTQETELEGRLGQLEANRLAELRNLSQAQASGNWQQVLQSTQNLATMATQAQQFAQGQAASMLPYYTQTETQRQAQPRDWASTIGEVPEAPSNASSAGSVPLRAFASERGASIDYDPSSNSVIINGRRYSSDTLEAMGGTFNNGRWQLPQSVADALIGGF